MLKHPRYLTHYTSIDGLYGIVKDKCMWATDVMYLNDSKELISGISHFRSVIASVRSEVNSPVIDKYIEVLEGLSGDLSDEAYVICFCDDPNLLSQWRNYSDGGGGVAIHFAFDKLRNILTDGIASQVQYVGNLSFLNEGALYKELVKKFTQGGILETSNEADFSDIRNDILSYAVNFKHHSFKEEREWRFVFSKNVGREIKFRTRKSVIVPYLEIPFSEYPISRITVGPNSSEHSLTSLKNYIKQSNVGSIEIEKSSIPYRG